MTIYMTRHGESENNRSGIIGGNCHITEEGQKYARLLANKLDNKNLTVLTSDFIRTKETASYFKCNRINLHELNEIYSGIFEGMNLEDIKRLYPIEHKHRNSDKANNSYPEGESYIDVQKRVFSLFDRLDLNKDILIISHQATCRVIYSYFTNTPINKCTDIDINLHTLYKFDKNEFKSMFSCD